MQLLMQGRAGRKGTLATTVVPCTALHMTVDTFRARLEGMVVRLVARPFPLGHLLKPIPAALDAGQSIA